MAELREKVEEVIEVEKAKSEFSERAEIHFGTLVVIDKQKRTITVEHKNEEGEWLSRIFPLHDVLTNEWLDTHLLGRLGEDLSFIIVDGKARGFKDE